MNEKIPLKKFAGQLGAACGVEEETAQRFIKELFGLVADKLSEGETVAIAGLGKFSVNPSLDDPVVFVPDQEFADEVNAPFAMFEPIPMTEEMSGSNLDALSEVDEEYASCEDEIEAQECKVLPQEQAIEADMKETPVDVEENDEPASDEPEDEIAEESDTIAAEEIEQADAPAVEESVEEEDAVEETVEEAVEEVVEEDNVEAADLQDFESQSYIPEDEEEYIEYYDRPKSKFGLGFIIGLLVGLLIGALALAGYAIFFVNASSS